MKNKYDIHIRVRAGSLIIKSGSILLVEYNVDDGLGLHYVLPSGGVNPGESVIDAVKRETREETCIDVEVGRLAFIHEYVPHLDPQRDSKIPHAISLIFQCTIIGNKNPHLPEKPDLCQTAVKWIRFNELRDIKMAPDIREEILDFIDNGMNSTIYIEEHKLPVTWKDHCLFKTKNRN